MSEDLAAAYELIYQFESASIQHGAMVSPYQKGLIRLLAEDLGLQAEQHAFEELVNVVAQADSKWNKRTQALANEYYALSEQGRVDEADACRAEFIHSCPSAWYRGIAEDL